MLKIVILISLAFLITSCTTLEEVAPLNSQVQTTIMQLPDLSQNSEIQDIIFSHQLTPLNSPEQYRNELWDYKSRVLDNVYGIKNPFICGLTILAKNPLEPQSEILIYLLGTTESWVPIDAKITKTIYIRLGNTE